ncbi:MAG TPA: substrate-binding domain-containing protein [Pseudolabrys sp.]|nr:substrate-binding domain-containing protein [Pseudolabrys sp.]
MDIKILSTHAVQDVLREVGPAFERANGIKPTIDYDPANALKRRIEGGTAFDVAIVTRVVIDALVGQGKIVRESCTEIGRSGLGVAVCKGARKPDISTVTGFKRALLAARSVVRSKEGTSGLYFDTLLVRLGIAEAMRGKIVLGGSGRIAELVARGEAELAVQQIPELLPVSGVDFVGALPDELQLYTMFSAGISTLCGIKETAKAFIDGLTTQAAAKLLKAKGLEPARQ